MRLPRMTAWRWMIAVAIAAFGLGIWTIGRRRQGYQFLAAVMEYNERRATIQLSVDAGAGRWIGHEVVIPQDFDPLTARLPATSEPLRQRLLYFRRLRHKYEVAAQHPWLPVGPDPARPR